jgi:hypothetical protein
MLDGLCKRLGVCGYAIAVRRSPWNGPCRRRVRPSREYLYVLRSEVMAPARHIAVPHFEYAHHAQIMSREIAGLVKTFEPLSEHGVVLRDDVGDVELNAPSVPRVARRGIRLIRSDASAVRPGNIDIDAVWSEEPWNLSQLSSGHSSRSCVGRRQGGLCCFPLCILSDPVGAGGTGTSPVMYPADLKRRRVAAGSGRGQAK